jgi:predicted ArsR family transcriptional regulator
MFPQRYDLFAQLLLDEVGLLRADDIEPLTSDQKRSLLIKRTVDRLADRFSFPVEGRSLDQRVAAVTDVLHLIGGFAEWCQCDDGFEIRDYNCVFARLVPEQVSGCEWHTRLLAQLLKWPVRHEVTRSGRSQHCRYVISPDAGPLTGEELLLNA